MAFVMFPTDWIHRGLLAEFGPPDVWALKAMFGLAIVRGELEREREAPHHRFPASISQIARAAHLSRNDAVGGLRTIVQRSIVARQDERGAEFGAHPRTSVFRFTGPPAPFFPFPFALIKKQRLLADIRRGRAALAALQTYLLLGAFRDNGSGTTRLGYEKLVEYGVRREFIHRGLMVLCEAGLVTRYEPTDERPYTLYFLEGIRRRPQARSRRGTALSFEDAIQ